ncbi:MAG: hypothetical protein WAO56_01785 [Miniphocaeibacter sp.]|uniref:hypothetical protein n=1 Tax=Miniphocaeibacter sp. TaxID=3100973 RepID=UPI003BB0BC81
MRYPFNARYKNNNIIIRSKSKCKNFDLDGFIKVALKKSEKDGIIFDFKRLIVFIENTTYVEKGIATGYSTSYSIEESSGLCTDVKYIFTKTDEYYIDKGYTR